MTTANTPCIPNVPVRVHDTCLYSNYLKIMDAFPSDNQQSPKERLLANGLDEETADTYLRIINTYEQAIATAEADYKRVVMECSGPSEPSGRAEHHIVSAYYKRSSDYDKATETMLEQIRQLAEQTGYRISGT